MNTVIAHSKKSNDFDAMSPALTKENTENVVDSNDAGKTASTLVSRLKSITSANSLSKIVVVSADSLEGQHEDAGNSHMSPENGKTRINVTATAQSSEKVVPHKNIDNGSTHQQLVKETIDDIDMTPKIILPCISTAGLQSLQTAMNQAPTLDNSSGNASVKIESADEVSTNGLLPRQIPSVTDLSDDHASIESRASDVIRRIRHMQSILATRHTKHQLMNFVENQCKHLRNKELDGVSSTNSLANSYSFSMPSTTEELNSMSTSALVDLVQRMHAVSNIKNSEGNKNKNSVLTLPCKEKARIQRTVGVTVATLKQMQVDIDSDATASSSGGETDDENINATETGNYGPAAIYDDAHLNTHQVHTIKNNDCWRWTRDRAMVISRWTWLQAQVSDLEYRIRQHGEIHKQLRALKNPILPAPNASQSVGEDSTQRAARCIPLLSSSCSRRHKLVHVSRASALSQKARRPVGIRCQCVKTVRRCAICAGHHNYAKPLDIQLLPSRERISLLDPGFHPVLSFTRDVNPGIELEEIINSSDKKHTITSRPVIDKKRLKINKKLLAETLKKKKLAQKLKKAKEKENNKKQKLLNVERKPSLSDCIPVYLPERNATKKKKLSNKLKVRKKPGPRVRTKSLQNFSDEEEEQMEQRHAESSLAQSAPTGGLGNTAPVSTNKRVNLYDIDDIVIPYHIAAATRVEKLQCKEIDTPRWRECVINGKTVHEQIRRRSSSVSVPMTPMTPALSESKLPTLGSSSAATLEPSCNEDVMECVTTPLSIDTMYSGTGSLSPQRSSSSSLVTMEIEDLSDHRFIARHNVLEVKEKHRYMNFVTSSRRPRTHSSTVMGAPIHKVGVSSGLLSPGNSTHSVSQHCVQNPVSTNNNSDFQVTGDHTSSIPLSSSHDAMQLKDELAAGDRKRSSSFTANRPKRDHSLFVADKPLASPWQKRSFPLAEEDLKAVQIKPKQVSNSWHNFENEEWKVIPTEEVPENDKSPLVLKLSKT